MSLFVKVIKSNINATVCAICRFDICQNIRHFVRHAVYKKSFEKYLTIESKDGKISKLSIDGIASQLSKNFSKDFEKNLKKVLTRGKRCGIIVKLSARAGSENGH